MIDAVRRRLGEQGGPWAAVDDFGGLFSVIDGLASSFGFGRSAPGSGTVPIVQAVPTVTVPLHEVSVFRCP